MCVYVCAQVHVCSCMSMCVHVGGGVVEGGWGACVAAGLRCAHVRACVWKHTHTLIPAQGESTKAGGPGDSNKWTAKYLKNPELHEVSVRGVCHWCSLMCSGRKAGRTLMQGVGLQLSRVAHETWQVSGKEGVHRALLPSMQAAASDGTVEVGSERRARRGLAWPLPSNLMT